MSEEQAWYQTISEIQDKYYFRDITKKHSIFLIASAFKKMLDLVPISKIQKILQEQRP